MGKVVLWASILCFGLLFWWGGKTFEGWNQKSKEEEANAHKLWQQEVERRGMLPGRIAEVDRLLDKKKWKEADEKLTALVKDATPDLVLALRHRQAEIQYRLCEENLARFLFFWENNYPQLESFDEEMGEERDRAARFCNQALSILDSLKPASSEEQFFVNYALGNASVRRALLAASAEELTSALSRAIESYIKGLGARDDYETKFNEELLLRQKEQAAAAMAREKKQLTPQDFLIRPPTSGAWKSKI